jgi:hypothetical protein
VHYSFEEALNKLIPLMPFDFTQKSLRQAHQKRNQLLAIRPEPVEGLNQSFFMFCSKNCQTV